MPAVASHPAPSPRPSRALLGRVLDPLCLGGFSLLVPLGVMALLSGGLSRQLLARAEHWVAVLIVLPHFLSSYQLLYWDYRRRLAQPRLFAVAAAVPLGLAALLASVFLSKAPVVPLWVIVQAMFFLSGWHYLKQTFGCALAGCALAGSPLDDAQRLALRANLWALGALAYLAPNCSPRVFSFAGLTYSSLGLPQALLWLAYAALAGTAAWLLTLLAKRKTAPAPAAIAAVLAFYAWSLPILVKPDLFYTFRFVPFAAGLHSLQYLTFVGPLRWRRLERGAGGAVPLSKTLVFVGGWLLMAFALAPVLFYKAPGWLDRAVSYDKVRLGPVFFVAAVHLFVNIHHYFIDSAIWRRDNEDLRALIARP